MPALPGHLSPAVGFSLKISTDVIQNLGCVLWKFPVSHLQNGRLGHISFDSAEAASSGPHIRKTCMKNRFQMGSELTRLLARPGMEIIYILIFCVFFKR